METEPTIAAGGRTEELSGSREKIVALDGLRAVAVSLVVLHHVHSLLPEPLRVLTRALDAGYLGVEIFFTLSGFLITRILLADRSEGVPIRYFMARRAIRIFPAFYFLVGLVWWFWGGKAIPYVATYTSNFWFAVHGGGGSLTHTWSLAVEEHFYLLWPIVMALAPLRWLPGLTLGIFAPLAVAVSLWLAFGVDEAWAIPLVQFGTQSRALSLLLGAALALGERRWRVADRRADVGWMLLLVLGACAVHGTGSPNAPAGAIGRYLGWAIFSTATVALVVRGDPRRGAIRRALRSDPMVHVGRISYGIYLYHLPILYAVGLFVARSGRDLRGWHGFLGVVLSLAAAEASWRILEAPLLKLKRHFYVRQGAGAGAARS